MDHSNSKFVTNPPSLQKWIDAQEATPTLTTSAKTIGDPVEVEASEETYVETTLPVNRHSCQTESALSSLECPM